jgi:hypothetical protein
MLVTQQISDDSKMAEGYQKVANLMTKHLETSTFQRFDFLNTLNILYLQAELVHLERDLRASMARDLESGSSRRSSTSMTLQHPSTGDVDGESKNEKVPVPVVISVDSKDAETKTKDLGVGVDARSITGSTSSGVESVLSEAVDERKESVRDWWYLSNGEDSRTWEIMLKTRKKLAEYSQSPRFFHLDIP